MTFIEMTFYLKVIDNTKFLSYTKFNIFMDENK